MFGQAPLKLVDMHPVRGGAVGVLIVVAIAAVVLMSMAAAAAFGRRHPAGLARTVMSALTTLFLVGGFVLVLGEWHTFVGIGFLLAGFATTTATLVQWSEPARPVATGALPMAVPVTEVGDAVVAIAPVPEPEPEPVVAIAPMADPEPEPAVATRATVKKAAVKKTTTKKAAAKKAAAKKAAAKKAAAKKA
ncbi:MAG: hypothetical protein ACOYNI_03980, partial [Acidimicrobiia bacterium]